MKELELPTQLKGSWHHALILTYGANIPFFENALWRQFNRSCRNKIILADGRRYLESCIDYAHSGLARHLNQLYVAEGIFTPHAAHAKLILLTNPKQGRLLVGSGNLGWQGYASGGEQFSQYEYNIDSDDGDEVLNAFLTVRELVETLLSRGHISSEPAKRRIRRLLEQTPWLYQSPVGHWQPVRHNLNDSFLNQLQQAVGDEAVKELWLLSPFYDEKAVALKRMLKALKPRRATLLVQPGYTSVDPGALQRMLDKFTHCQVRAFSINRHSPYVHAKLYLLKLPDRAICLQGSPNLSQVAMLRPASRGNIELANLLTGPPKVFDYLLKALDIRSKAVPLNKLDLSYTKPEAPPKPLSNRWYLTGGEWHNDQLSLTFQGALPDLKQASLVIANRVFGFDVRHQEAGRLELKLSPGAVALLGQPVPITIRWGEGDDALTSNPIFVCNRAALDAVLEVTDESETLGRIGELDLDDEEFEQLLGELDAALMIDRRSVWQLAGRPSPTTTNDDDDESLRLSYADINYDMLRRHPKIVQYVDRGLGGRGYTHSRLQIILNAITDHFRGLLDVSVGPQLIETMTADLEESQAETEAEREQEEEEKQQWRRTSGQRLQRILKNFIRRYLRGLRSPDFQELAGFEVITQNYIIFTHMLWRLFAKGWVETEFVVDSLLQTWTFFWGSATQTGYYRELDETQQTQALQWIQEHHADAGLLAALYYSAHLTRLEHWQKPRFSLRDFWRELLRHPPFEATGKTLEETWRIVSHLIPYKSPPPTTIVDELASLSQFETKYNFLCTLEAKHQYPRHSCAFEKVTVWRRSLSKDVSVSCLVLRIEEALADKDAAIALLQAWMRSETLDYYRIASPDRDGSHKMLLYEVSEASGLYWARDRGEDPVDFGPVVLQPLDWEVALLEMKDLAAQVDADLVLAPARTSVPSLR